MLWAVNRTMILFMACLTKILRAGLLVFGAEAAAGEWPDVVPGPVQADVEHVIDGDTFWALAYPWPGQAIRVAVRPFGIDTPELRGRCAAEKAAARRARSVAVELLTGQRVALSEIHTGTYADRVIAVVNVAGRNLTDLLLERAPSRPYYGGRRQSWCE